MRAVFALEFLNAKEHLAPGGAFPARGGTPAQLLMPSGIQRLSRDLDFVGIGTNEEFEAILDRIAAHYGGQLFTWKERVLSSPRLPMHAYEVAFPTPAGPTQTLVLDVVPIAVTLPYARLPLNRSSTYRPLDPNDAVLTLSADAFIADKLPTLGFDTHGYPRPTEALSYEGHPEHIWKQIHDLAGLRHLPIDLGVVHQGYVAGIAARNVARGLALSPAACLADAWRVCDIAVAALNGYPADDLNDAHYLWDVLHVRAGINTYAQYAIGRWTPTARLRSAAQVSFLVAALREIEEGELTPVDVNAVAARVGEVQARLASLQRKDPLHQRFVARRNGIAWGWAIESSFVYRLAPEAALYLLVAGDLVGHAKHLSAEGAFAFEA